MIMASLDWRMFANTMFMRAMTARHPQCRKRRNGTPVRLFDPHRVTAADRPPAQHGRIDADVDLVVLSCRPENARVSREITLRQRGHDAAGAGTGDVQAN